MDAKRIVKNPLTWVLVVFVAGLIALTLGTGSSPQQVDTSKAEQLLSEGHVARATFRDGDRLDLRLTGPTDIGTGHLVGEVFTRYVPEREASLVERVRQARPAQGYTDVPAATGWVEVLAVEVLPILLLVGLLWLLLGRGQNAAGGIAAFGRSRATAGGEARSTVRFADVAGVDEAVEELREITDFLTRPAAFTALGARIPKGVLLYGPPGTGKTLLARAVAGEAGVPFYSLSGSDFVEMFVGVGASRVRDLFDKAKESAPAIVFVDEIDAVGRHRGAGLGGGHDEREQTLNQLLVEMDGFDATTGVVLVAATNRPDILDPALLRPGRFDRQIAVDAPDLAGRAAVLEVHARDKRFAKGVDLDLVARRTPGFTGADLSNVLNEAALLTVRAGRDVIDDRALDEAIDRVMAGPQKRTRVLSLEDRKRVAYHEGGHAVVAAALHHIDPVTKVTILPRGRALGYTMVAPVEERYSIGREQLLDRLAYSLGGRVADEMVFADPTSGASDDIAKATELARRMVTEYGMSGRVGAIHLGEGSGEVFLGRDVGRPREYGEDLAAVVDDETRALLDAAHDEAWTILSANREILDRLVLDLLEHESLGPDRLATVFADLTPAPRRAPWSAGDGRVAGGIPPVLTPAERAALPPAEPAIAPPAHEPTQPDETPGGGHDDPSTR